MILVTGATGFVGRHLIRRLKDRPARAMVREGSSPRFARTVEVVEAVLAGCPGVVEGAVAVRRYPHVVAPGAPADARE